MSLGSEIERWHDPAGNLLEIPTNRFKVQRRRERDRQKLLKKAAKGAFGRAPEQTAALDPVTGMVGHQPITASNPIAKKFSQLGGLLKGLVGGLAKKASKLW